MDAILPTTASFRPRVILLDNLGTLEKKKLTDLVILGVDQLEDINNIRKISLFIKSGHVVDREILPTERVLNVPRGTPVRRRTRRRNNEANARVNLDALLAPSRQYRDGIS